jgi:hypothetical protein
MIALYYKMLFSETVDKKRLLVLAILCYISMC